MEASDHHPALGTVIPASHIVIPGLTRDPGEHGAGNGRRSAVLPNSLYSVGVDGDATYPAQAASAMPYSAAWTPWSVKSPR